MDAPPIQDDPRAEEVRVALALNGGVSLAIWMGGCAVELDCARRAHLAPEPTRSVYHGLSTALKRMLVLDVMSGASAGGINGALMACAIRRRRRLSPDWMRDSWLELGDLWRLLHRPSEPAPTSLMQGDQFAEDLVATFEELMTSPQTALAPEQEAVRELDVVLDVATTDLHGDRRAFVDHWGANFVAREHRALFRFRDRDDFIPETLGAAARASASFPLAFEPRRVESPAATLAGFSGSRWMIDGGLLNNAPIDAALESIPLRPAERQVRRFVCYLNADPPPDVVADAGSEVPPIARIVGQLVSLPRSVPVVDQLDAIERATRRGELGADLPTLRLVTLELDALRPIARSLFPAYRTRRRLASLEDVMGDAARARKVLDLFGDTDRLPWVPDSLAPLQAGVWQWGGATAERTLQLFLDVLRPSLAGADDAAQDRLFAARKEIEDRLVAVDGLRRAVVGAASSDTPQRAVTRFAKLAEGLDPLPSLRSAAGALFAVADLLGDFAEPLFGPGWRGAPTLGEARFLGLLNRAVAIEVVTRSFGDDTPLPSGQRISFAQLTPFAPSPIFTDTPRQKPGWARPQDKLTGIPLAHFAAFHRRSWRANDFMWGRLDAAARTVDLLVSTTRATQLAERGLSPWTVLADTLVPEDATKDQLWLVHEALTDFGVTVGEERAELHAALAAALHADLLDGDGGAFTRVVCTRGAQLEILAEELPTLEETSGKDFELGAGTPPLGLPLGTELRPAIEALRTGKSLKARLTADDEAASTLAIATATRAALVSLGVLRGSNLPLVGSLFALRALLLPVGGSVARNRVLRGIVVAAFTAALIFLTARVVGTEDAPASLELLWSWSAATAAIAVLIVAGVVAVPAFRGWKTKRRPMKYGAFGWAAGLLAAALVPLALAHWAGDLSWSQLIAAPGDDAPPDWVLALVVSFFVGAPLIAIPLRAQVAEWLASPWAGTAATVVAGGLALLVTGVTVYNLFAELDDPAWWRWLSLAFPIAGAVTAGLYLFWRWPRAA